MPKLGSDEWLAQVTEDIIEPDLPIVDPHHHLWNRDWQIYEIEDLLKDTGSGHNVIKTLYMECGSSYHETGPEHLKPVGETEYVISQLKKGQEIGGAEIAGIIGKADLRLGDDVEEVLKRHIEAAEGRFRGIRHAGAWVEDRSMYSRYAGHAPEGLYDQEDFRTGVRLLGQMGLTYDTYHYHYQNDDFRRLSIAAPDTQMILDHFGTPLGVGPFANRRDEVFDLWASSISDLAKCDNVVVKIGGLAMPDNGFGWDTRATPATSDEFVKAQRPYYLHAINCFGVDRCMVESNFPVDRLSLSYHILFNGIKKIVADFSNDEKHQLFHGTAERVYNV